MNNIEPVFVWEIMGSIPTHGNKTYPSYDNVRFAVIARTMERVMIISREAYPEMRFHSIQKRNYLGKESVLIDTEVKTYG
jgi:hypothetical protein